MKLLVAYMRKLKLNHTTAINGLEALNTYKEAAGAFDVIFMGKCNRCFERLQFFHFLPGAASFTSLSLIIFSSSWDYDRLTPGPFVSAYPANPSLRHLHANHGRNPINPSHPPLRTRERSHAGRSHRTNRSRKSNNAPGGFC